MLNIPLHIIDAAIFGALAVGVLFALFASGARKGKRNFSKLAWVIGGAFAVVLAYQTCWQLGVFGGDRFHAFMRQHNTREGSASFRVQRGKILDANGEVLAERGEARLRRYPLGAAAVHVVGYYDRRFGVTGVERMMNATLRGEETATGNMAQTLAKKIGNDRVTGGDVWLTLDARLQQFASEQMAGKTGAIVVMRPDGALLALVSAPSYAPEDAATAMRDAEGAPLLNRAVAGLYPPGSTFKIVMALGALGSGQRFTFECPAEGFMGIRDNDYYAAQRRGATWGGRGAIGVGEAFVHSSNVWFSQLAVALGQARLETLGEMFRLDERWVYALDAGREMQTTAGKFPSAKLRREQAQVGIGQGAMVVTPLHVAMWTSAVAGGGALWQPRLLATEEPKLLWRVADASAAREVAGFMREAVSRGTGRNADVPGLRVCGKTGTAQVGGGADHAWFTCFAPQENPQIVVTVLVERGGFGGAVAAPIARAVLEEAARLGVVRP